MTSSLRFFRSFPTVNSTPSVFLPRLVLSSQVYSVSGRSAFSTNSSPSSPLIVSHPLEHPGLVVFELNRPENRNALSADLLQQLSDEIQKVNKDKSARVLVIRSGIPKVFCAGADLKARLALSEPEVEAVVKNIRATFMELENVEVPSIAVIEGMALGGGLEMALACDFRILGKEARVGLVETQLAIIPGAGGTQRLPRLIGPSKAKELIFTGRIVDAPTALHLGIADHMTDKGLAFEKAVELAKEISACGPIGVRAAKQSINKGIDLEKSKAMQVEEEAYRRVVYTHDRVEALRAFIDKRKPHFHGN